ncbi:MAG: SDR family oxidoreductase [Bacteroidetes bacterium]|nr:SDR family oxidoreductase [Bacteroidota bacterium]
MNSFSLNDKKILVCGASSGIGRQAAISSSKLGARLVITARNKQNLQQTFDQLEGKGHQMIIADLTKEEELNALISEMPELNGIVHSAGIVRPLPIKFITEKHLDEMFGINYTAPVLLTSKLLRSKKMRKGSSIVFMSSISSRFGHLGGALYCGSKAGVDVFTKVLALECAAQKIRANTINASMVKTELFNSAEQMVSKETMALHEKKYPLGFGEPVDIANAIIFLLSDASKWITGTNLIVDGGLSAGDY